ncbi:Rz-like spanin [Erwinia phage vB_EamM-Bue1]|uniref:Uncharacterized protein n=2 Tax=Nezavisimistyvirus TaxID=2841279 RepID=A0A0A0YSU3_9CAUD|nr:Rz-like spanin [Erwinia phage phiEa2809]YP_009837692.1 Rz-like spanin [Erwinia phage vB_EamM-Bue1]AIX13090.1 hypothetical protein NW77_082 [Erwinia phage phiEa2809]AVO22933.1 hypothetical protein [Erwinia phage vB_EamM-Bue1]
MKYLAIILALYTVTASAQPDEIHTCLAWLTTYDETHNDRQTGLLKAKLELELKKSKVFNPTQLHEAANDKQLQTSAQGEGRDTTRTLIYCSRIASDFVR